jgi:undecaprenyl-diphosphatase
VPDATIASEVRDRPRLARWIRFLDPTKTTDVALAIVAIVAILGAVMAGVLLAMVRTKTGFARWDLAAARWGQRHASSSSTRVLRRITFFGGTLPTIGVGLVALALVWRRVAPRRAFGFLLLAIGGGVALVNGAKFLVDRARPDLDPLTGFSGSSFPSGHAAAAAVTFASVALLLSRGRSRRVQAALFSVAVGVAVAIAASRVLLGVHWLTDVLAGLAFGWGWFAVASLAFGGRELRFGAPAEAAVDAAATAPPPPADEGSIART